VAIARSRSVADPVVERFDLQQVYQVPYAEDAYNVLNRHLEVNFDNQQSLLTLGITDKDPNRSAALTNALVEELERRSINLTLGSAQRERAFLESHLIEVKHGLVAAEEALKKFQEGNQTFQLDEQTRAIVEAIGNLQGELAGKEIAAGVLRTFQTERNPQLQALKAEISGIRRQIQALENSPVGNEISSRSSVTTGKIPELGLEFGRLLRDFKVKETLYENLSKQYELKRVAEANTTSPLQVLDRAIPPQRKSGPKRLFIMVLTTCSTLFLTTVGIFLWDAWQRVTASNQELWDQIKGRILWRRKK
jgi:capsule polysaccharide export protein KpsE/RkpR